MPPALRAALFPPAEGRICLDILNMPPKGAWKPSLNVPTLLASIGLLLAEPNPDDGLVTDVVRPCTTPHDAALGRRNASGVPRLALGARVSRVGSPRLVVGNGVRGLGGCLWMWRFLGTN
jgi:hypothetical protein